MARPEIGLGPVVQKLLLERVLDSDVERLNEERRRLITDAITTAADERYEQAGDANETETVNEIVRAAEARHKNIWGKASAWSERLTIVEEERK